MEAASASWVAAGSHPRTDGHRGLTGRLKNQGALGEEPDPHSFPNVFQEEEVIGCLEESQVCREEAWLGSDLGGQVGWENTTVSCQPLRGEQTAVLSKKAGLLRPVR